MEEQRSYVLVYQLDVAHIFQVEDFDLSKTEGRRWDFTGTYLEGLKRASQLMDDRYLVETAHCDCLGDAASVRFREWDQGVGPRRDRFVLSSNQQASAKHRPHLSVKQLERKPYRRHKSKKPEIIGTKYEEYLRSEHWHEVRQRMILKFGSRCQFCNRLSESPHVHHRTYENLGHEKDEDLTLFCKRCHEFLHKHIKIEEHEGRRDPAEQSQPTKRRKKQKRRRPKQW